MLMPLSPGLEHRVHLYTSLGPFWGTSLSPEVPLCPPPAERLCPRYGQWDCSKFSQSGPDFAASQQSASSPNAP